MAGIVNCLGAERTEHTECADRGGRCGAAPRFLGVRREVSWWLRGVAHRRDRELPWSGAHGAHGVR